jgi:uncharacterized protein with HEPN domain
VPPREWRIRLEDILEAISRIEEYTRGLEFEAFAGDRLRSDAVILRIVWDTLRSDLPALREQLQRVLDQEPFEGEENGA